MQGSLTSLTETVRRAIDQAVAKEREECARIADEFAVFRIAGRETAAEIADKIRARRLSS